MQINKKQLKNNQGFTLIELLITLAIISVILGISLATINFSRLSDTQQLTLKVENLIDRAKNFAISYNKITRLLVDNNNGRIYTQYFDYENNTWHNVKLIDNLEFSPKKDKELFNSSKTPTLTIRPSGKILSKEIIINTNDEIITITLEDDNENIDENNNTLFN